MKSHLTETLENYFGNSNFISTRAAQGVPTLAKMADVRTGISQPQRSAVNTAGTMSKSRLGLGTQGWSQDIGHKGSEKQVEFAGGRDRSAGWQERAYTGGMKDAQGKLPFVSHCVSIRGTLLFRNISTHRKIDFEKLRTADYVISPKKHFTLVENYFCWLM